jgi:hypothetical protein
MFTRAVEPNVGVYTNSQEYQEKINQPKGTLGVIQEKWLPTTKSLTLNYCGQRGEFFEGQ